MKIVVGSECTHEQVVLHSAGNSLSNLLVCLGYDACNPPLADLLSRYHHLEGSWVVVSPVHWQVGHNNAMIDAYGQYLELDEVVLKESFHSFAQHLLLEGLTLYYHDASTWLLSTQNKSLLQAHSIDSVYGKPLMPALSALDKTMYWQKFLTESQMFFAANHTDPFINGIWVWGSAALLQQHDVAICADEHFLAWAQLCSSQVTLYNPELSLHDFALLMLQDITLLSAQHQKQLQKMTSDWYWNNTAYQQSCPNWFIRLWRKRRDAH